MKSDQSKNRIAGALLVFSLLFGIGIVLSTTAQAQVPDRDNETKIDAVATGIVTVTMAAPWNCVAPL